MDIDLQLFKNVASDATRQQVSVFSLSCLFRIPPNTFGWSVFTLPPKIDGWFNNIRNFCYINRRLIFIR